MTDGQIMKQSDCEKIYGTHAISNHTVCTHGNNGNKGTCFGDSGGPLVCLDDNESSYILVGIVSWGVGCGSAFPEVFVSVSFYLEFIYSTIKGIYHYNNFDYSLGWGL